MAGALAVVDVDPRRVEGARTPPVAANERTPCALEAYVGLYPSPKTPRHSSSEEGILHMVVLLRGKHEERRGPRARGGPEERLLRLREAQGDARMGPLVDRFDYGLLFPALPRPPHALFHLQ